MREGLLRDFLFQAHAKPEAVDESESVVLPAQVIHGVNDCVCTLCRKTIQQAVQRFVDFRINMPYNLVGTVQKCRIIRAILPEMLGINAVM